MGRHPCAVDECAREAEYLAPEHSGPRSVNGHWRKVCQMHRHRMRKYGTYDRSKPCKQCGLPFDAQRKALVLYCSPECRALAHAPAVPAVPAARACIECGRDFMASVGQTVCSHACRRARDARGKRERWMKRAREQRVYLDVVCPVCGAAFDTTYMSKAYCSRSCRRRFEKDVRGARKRAVYVEDVWRSKVYERDNYVCQLCHRPVKMAERVPHPKAPTLDHIIPLAAGGTHEYANVQLAHFMCNSIKGTGDAQLRMELGA